MGILNGREQKMKRDEVLAIIAAHREQLQNLGVKSLDLFGSVARDEARPDSDVDFLVEFNRPGGLFQLLQVQYYLEDILGCSVDLGDRDALREHLRKPVLKDVLRAF
jgi:predicted nucleotidyltransferase